MIGRVLRSLRSRFADMSLKYKLLASYLLVLIIPMVLFGVYAVQTSRQSVIQNASMALNKMVEKSEELYSLKVEQLENLISLCAFQPELQTVYRNEYDGHYELYLDMKNVLLPFIKNVREYCGMDVDRLCVYSAKGLKYNAPYVDSLEAVAGEEWFAQAMGQGGILWHMQEDQMLATCRIDPLSMGPSREPLGLVYCSLNYPFFLKSYVEINWHNYRLEIFDAQGERLHISEYGDKGMLENDAEPLSFSFTWPKQQWTFRYTVPIASISGEEDELLQRNMGVIFVSSALLVLMVLAFTQVQIRGIRLLQDKMVRVQQGELNIEVFSPAKDEIGVLTNTFGVMLRRIQELIEKVKQTEQRSGNLELQALRAQIDPHFLYNTLSYINWQALKSGNEPISFAVSQLSQFYRTCLNEGKELIAVKQEVDNARAYVELQRLMHNGSFEAEFEVEEAACAIRMLSFLLQPLIENAIIHGIDERAADGGHIWVRCRLDAPGDIVFEVEDNGPGLTGNGESPVKFGQSSRHGYGITNIEQRIRLFYGEGYGLCYERGGQGGCLVRLRLKAILEQDVHKSKNIIETL